MASKNISLPEDVYRKLDEEKRAGESFGDVINRLLRSRPLSAFWGVWSEETADRALTSLRDGRARSDEKLDQLYD
jgi:predicted CopG family antitoxin